MKIDHDMRAFGQIEDAALIEKYRQLGASDGRRHYPSTDAQVAELAERIGRDFIEPAKQLLAGQLQQELSQAHARVSSETMRADDDRREVETLVSSCSTQLEGQLRTARTELTAAADRCRDQHEALQKFKAEHEEALRGRDPLPKPTRWQRWIDRKHHALVTLLAMGIEFGAFVLLGQDAMREAIGFGLIGGGVSAAWIWCLRRLLTDGATEHALGGRHRTQWVIAAVMAAMLCSAYLMACIRDTLLAINHEGHVQLDRIVVAPGALSAESTLVFLLSAALMALTWLLSLGRRKFAFEDQYRRVYDEARLADEAYRTTKDAMLSQLHEIARAGRDRINSLGEEREDGRRASSAAFGDAQRRLRMLHVHLGNARKVAQSALDAYAAGNRAVRGPGNPLPAAFNNPIPFDPSPGLERDLTAGFRRDLEHARGLAAEARAACSQALHALGAYVAEVLRHANRLTNDPLMRDEPPRFDDLLLLEQQAPAFDSTSPATPERHASRVKSFLGIEKDAA